MGLFDAENNNKIMDLIDFIKYNFPELDDCDHEVYHEHCMHILKSLPDYDTPWNVNVLEICKEYKERNFHINNNRPYRSDSEKIEYLKKLIKKDEFSYCPECKEILKKFEVDGEIRIKCKHCQIIF